MERALAGSDEPIPDKHRHLLRKIQRPTVTVREGTPNETLEDYDPTELEVTPTKAVKWEYGYDWLDRLVTVSRAEAADVGSLGATTLQREYVFDESDNRVFFDDHVNDVTYHYVYATHDSGSGLVPSDVLEEILVSSTAGDRTLPGDFVSLETFEHDPDGNMTKRTLASTGEEISYKWTEFDRLERIESDQEGRMQDARYDVGGLRERKLDKNGNSSVEYGVGITTSASVPGTSYSSAPNISYLMGHMLLGAEIDGEFRYNLGDALSSVRDVVDDDGTLIRSFEWDEYGNLLSSSGSGTVSPKTWIGGLSVNDDTSDSGMFNMGHRNYAAGVLGRFISRDPIGFAGGLNLYSYGNNNPLRFVDAAGLNPWDFRHPRYSKYRASECAQLRKNIVSARKQIERRIRQLNDNCNQDAPLPPIGIDDHGKPGSSVRAHEWLLAKEQARYLLLQLEYMYNCSDKFGPPPPIVFEPLPVYVPQHLPRNPEPLNPPSVPNLSPSDPEWWLITAAAAYGVASAISRLYPPRNLVPVP